MLSEDRTSQKTPFSLVLNTRNEVASLARAIDSVVGADEIIVVDMESTDGTDELARRLGAQVFRHELVDYVEPARAFAVAATRNEWVLILDADEELTPELADTIDNLINEAELKQYDAYLIPRKNILFGQWIEHAGWWPDYQLRLFRKSEVEWGTRIHQPPTCHGTTCTLPDDVTQCIVHHNYSSIDDYLERLIRYTAIEAKTALSSDAAPAALKPGELSATFFQEYHRRLFAQDGTRSGLHGEALSLLQAVYQSVTRLRVWEAHGFAAEQDRDQLLASIRAEVTATNYWLANEQVKRSRGLSRWWWRIRRKLRF